MPDVIPGPAESGRRLSWALSFGVACASALVYAAFDRLPSPMISDIDQVHGMARALLHGENPYVTLAGRYDFPLHYPLPAALILIPLAPFPGWAARALWAGVLGGVLAWAGRRRPPLLIGLLSACFLNALISGQWSPLLVSGTVLPLLSVLWVAKPTVGLALFAGYPSRAAIFGGLALVGLALVIEPRWPLDWWETRTGLVHVPLLLRWGGPVLLVTLARWRHPEARVLLAMAFLPVSPSLYEALPCFLVAERRREAYGLAILTLLAAYLIYWFEPAPDRSLPVADQLRRSLDVQWMFVLALVYVPTLVLLLRRPPRPRDTARPW